jgi:hypothetical protein
MPDNPHSPHGNYNPLERVIKAASNESNYSWCGVSIICSNASSFEKNAQLK